MRLPGWHWRPTRIGPRLFAFNLLVVFVPAIGIIYLDVYEARLLEAQERAMVQQARLLAAVLGDSPAIDAPAAARSFTRLERRTDARLRVFAADGTLLADSRAASGPQPEGAAEPPGDAAYDQADTRSRGAPGVRERILYRVGAALAGVRARIRALVRSWWIGRLYVQRAPAGDEEPELRQALAGRYGAGTHHTPGQRSLTLVSAVPVRHQGTVTGAVVVSQSTFRILQALYGVRLRIFQVVVMSVAAAAGLTAVAAMAIVRPLRRLRSQASALAERRRTLRAGFPGTDRRDEIGDLARALDELTRRLDEHIARLESFAADLAHEFRNPLASIRTAAETIEAAGDPADRRRFVELMRRDVARLDRLVAGVREMARIDGQLEQEPLHAVDLHDAIVAVIESARLTQPGADIAVTTPPRPCLVRGTRERLAQAFENLLANALSFAPPGSRVDVAVEASAGGFRVEVSDRGPGIPEGHLSRVFERFFSYRPAEKPRDHLGLGLPIAKQIVESYGGVLTAHNREGGGAVFRIELPAAK